MKSYLKAVTAPLVLLSATSGTIAEGRLPTLVVPSDPSATYEALSAKLRQDHKVEIVTKRRGRSGVSFSKRLVDCVAGTAKYLGDGDSLEEMERSKPDKNMTKPVQGSITFYVASYACAHGK